MKRAKREEDPYYDSAETYDALHREEQVAKISLILQHLAIEDDDRLLDVGCGTAFSFDYWPARDLTGAEPSSAMIRHAKHRNLIMHVRAEDMSIFDDDEFDVVVCVTALHNMAGPEDALKEMKRVGKRKFAITLLRKSERFDELERLIKRMFSVDVIDDNPWDRIYIAQ